MKEHLLNFLLRVRSTVASRQWSARCARRSRDSEQKLASSPRGRAICRRPLSCTLRLSQLSIRFNVPYHIISFQEAKAVVLLPFVMPPRENTRGVEWEAAAGTVSGRVCWVYLFGARRRDKGPCWFTCSAYLSRVFVFANNSIIPPARYSHVHATHILSVVPSTALTSHASLPAARARFRTASSRSMGIIGAQNNVRGF